MRSAIKTLTFSAILVAAGACATGSTMNVMTNVTAIVKYSADEPRCPEKIEPPTDCRSTLPGLADEQTICVDDGQSIEWQADNPPGDSDLKIKFKPDKDPCDQDPSMKGPKKCKLKIKGKVDYQGVLVKYDVEDKSTQRNCKDLDPYIIVLH